MKMKEIGPTGRGRAVPSIPLDRPMATDIYESKPLIVKVNKLVGSLMYRLCLPDRINRSPWVWLIQRNQGGFSFFYIRVFRI